MRVRVCAGGAGGYAMHVDHLHEGRCHHRHLLLVETRHPRPRSQPLIRWPAAAAAAAALCARAALCACACACTTTACACAAACATCAACVTCACACAACACACGCRHLGCRRGVAHDTLEHAVVRVPHSHGVVVGGGEDGSPVAAETHARDGRGVPRTAPAAQHARVAACEVEHHQLVGFQRGAHYQPRVGHVR